MYSVIVLVIESFFDLALVFFDMTPLIFEASLISGIIRCLRTTLYSPWPQILHFSEGNSIRGHNCGSTDDCSHWGEIASKQF